MTLPLIPLAIPLAMWAGSAVSLTVIWAYTKFYEYRQEREYRKLIAELKTPELVEFLEKEKLLIEEEMRKGENGGSVPRKEDTKYFQGSSGVTAGSMTTKD